MGSDKDRYFQNAEVFARETSPLFNFVNKYVDKKGIIFDVGGNIGLTAIAMSFASPESKIISFEPSPYNASLFIENTKQNNHIEIFQTGLSNKKGNLSFVIPANGANAHVATDNYQYSNHPDFHPTLVPITTLDSFCKEESIDEQNISLIKIDVEGFEPNVLVGGANLFYRVQPWIWMEFNSVALNVAHGYSPMAFATGLFKSFEVMRLESNGELLKLDNPACLVHDNIVFHKSIQDIILKPIKGTRMPTFEEFTLPKTVCDELNSLRSKKYKAKGKKS